MLKSLDAQTTFASCLSPYYAKLALYEWIIPIVTFLVIPYLITRRRDIRFLLQCIILIATLQALYGIAQHFLAEDPLPFFAPPYKEGKVGGTYLCRNTYACFLAMSIPLAFGLIADSLRNEHHLKVFALLGNLEFVSIMLSSIAIILGIFLSLSRGGILCLFLGLFVFLVLWSWNVHGVSRRLGYFFLFLIISFSFSYCYLIGLDPLLDRFGQEGGGFGRWEIWKTSITILKDHWLFGIGGGCFFLAWEIYKPPQIGSFWYAHNDYLQFIIEYGIISSIILCVFFLVCFYFIWKNFRDASSALYCGMISSIAVVFTHAFVDFSLNLSGNRLICTIFLGILLIKIPQSEKSDKI